MIFGIMKTETQLQVGDKTRLDGTKSFLSPDEAAITLVEIEPEASAGFIAVTSLKYMDWVYQTDGAKVVTLRITTDGSPETFTSSITVLSAADDKLFSSDQELITHEDDILRFLRAGRSSFLDKHRMAQSMIIDSLDQMGLTNNVGARLDKDDIYDIQEVNEWSKFLALYLIFSSVQAETNDVYQVKADKYFKMSELASKRATIRLDTNQDAVVDSKPDLYTGRLVRR